MTLHRLPGFRNEDTLAKVPKAMAYQQTLLKRFQIRMYPVMLSYQMQFFSWDMATLDEMQLAIYFHLRVNHQLNFPIKVNGEATEMLARVQDSVNWLFSDASVSTETGRLFVTSSGFDIFTLIIQNADVELMLPSQIIIEPVETRLR